MAILGIVNVIKPENQMINGNRNPEKTKLSEKIAADVEAFLKNKGKINKIPRMSDRQDVPTDQWTLMKQRAFSCKSRRAPKM